MWEAIAACTSIFMAWLAWKEHNRKEEEREARHRSGERASRRFTFPEIAPSQPTQKHISFRLTEVVGSGICGIAFWCLWFLLYYVILAAIFNGLVPGPTLGTILSIVSFILGIVLGRYVQKKVYPWLK